MPTSHETRILDQFTKVASTFGTAPLRSGGLPRWQALLFLVGVIFIGTPDGAELFNFCAALLMAVALAPYGVSLLRAPAEVDAGGA